MPQGDRAALICSVAALDRAIAVVTQPKTGHGTSSPACRIGTAE